MYEFIVVRHYDCEPITYHVQTDLHFEEASGIAGSLAKVYTGGYVVLTSHQLIWVDASASEQACGRSCSIPLAAVQEASLRSPLLWAAPKLCLRVQTDAAERPLPVGAYSEEVGTACSAHATTTDMMVSGWQSRGLYHTAGQPDEQAAPDAAA